MDNLVPESVLLTSTLGEEKQQEQHVLVPFLLSCLDLFPVTIYLVENEKQVKGKMSELK